MWLWGRKYIFVICRAKDIVSSRLRNVYCMTVCFIALNRVTGLSSEEDKTLIL
ncbi:MAG: hypothetical protein K2J90_02510 [Lachnospiraceae bacterium]|nr:hypothetical protein [Lachnospiraceae bacterium]